MLWVNFCPHNYLQFPLILLTCMNYLLLHYLHCHHHKQSNKKSIHYVLPVDALSRSADTILSNIPDSTAIYTNH